MIAYRKTNGRAHDARCVPDDHRPEPGEILLDADAVPPLDALHDPQTPEQIKAKRTIAEKEAATGFTRKQREYLIANGDGPLRAAFLALEAELDAERAKLR